MFVLTAQKELDAGMEHGSFSALPA
jgi:hypothetical protein